MLHRFPLGVRVPAAVEIVGRIDQRAVPMNVASVRNHEGVILRYGDLSELRPFHTEQKPQPHDRERIAVIKAGRELVVLEIIFEHLDLSDIARTRIDDALWVIYCALQSERRKLGMAA
jgi:hypothetical protein